MVEAAIKLDPVGKLEKLLLCNLNFFYDFFCNLDNSEKNVESNAHMNEISCTFGDFLLFPT